MRKCLGQPPTPEREPLQREHGKTTVETDSGRIRALERLERSTARHIRRLCLANGDYFDDVEVEADMDATIQAGGFVKILAGKKTVFVNTEFIVSYEL